MVTDKEQYLAKGDILVVDDEAINRKFLVDILTDSGYLVRPASDGKLALISVQTKAPELILLDYKMPGMSGVEVCHHLKSNPATEDIPIIFLSGIEETHLKVKAMEAGAIDYVTKPIKPAELFVRIENHLKLFRLQRKLTLQSEELRQEIKDHKLAKDTLQKTLEREQVLADIYRNAPIAIAYGQLDGRLENCNIAFAELTGYSLEELQNVNWSQTLTPKKWLQHETEKLKHLSYINNSIRYEKEYIRKNGEIIPVELLVTAKFDSERKLHYYIGFVTDISHRKKMETQLFLNEKLTTIAGLAAGVAHEINTPLSAILQAHQLIKIGLSPEEPDSIKKAAACNVDLVAVHDYFKENELDYFMTGIRESAWKAGTIIKSLLEFSRPHEGSFSSVNLNDLMDSSLLLSQADYGMKKKYNIMNVRVLKEYAPNSLSVTCVPTEIEQVLLNLIKNSVQAMAEKDLTEKPCLILRTAAIGDKAVIEVEDNGNGIPEETIKRIFDPFFTTKDVGHGAGLGLSVSHAIIVDKHKGQIRVENVAGKGARFIIKLPLKQES